jgi:lipopolysaccharide transport system permease protein
VAQRAPMIGASHPPRRPPALLQLLRSLSKNRRLLHDFVVRDLRSRYIGSSMGFFWSVIFPIINLFVYMFVFRIVLKTRWSDYQGATMVALIMLAGIVVWAAFSESMSRTTNILVENSNLIQKVVFPSEILPAYIVASSLINMLIAMPVVLLAVAYNIWIDPETDPLTLARAAAIGDPGLRMGVTLIALPVLVVLQAIFTTGLGMFFATLNLFWRDTYHLMGVAMTVWMFATPIFYPAHMVEREGFGWILDVNPMHWLIEAYRSIIINNQWPDPALLTRFAAAALAALIFGATFFFRQRRRFPDLL